MLLSRDPLWISWGPDLTFLYNDACAVRVLGNRHPAALGRSTPDVWGALWPAILANGLRTDAGGWDRAVPVERTIGGQSEELHLNFSCTPLHAHGAAAGSLWVVTDHTLTVLAQRRAHELHGDQAQPDEVLASLAHELRTPLNAILAWSQLLSAGVDAAEQQRGLTAIARSARTQVRLLDDMFHTAHAVDAASHAALQTAQAGSPGSETDPPGPDVNLSDVSVLVVDDDDVARGWTSRTLEQAGASVCGAASASDGLNCACSGRVDLIVSDITMPGMDGYEFMRSLRAARNGRDRVPAIALTSLTTSRDRQRAYKAGFQLHLAKPVEMEELVLAAANLTGRI